MKKLFIFFLLLTTTFISITPNQVKTRSVSPAPSVIRKPFLEPHSKNLSNKPTYTPNLSVDTAKERKKVKAR